MKKGLCFLLTAALMAASLAGCGSQSDSSANSQAEAKESAGSGGSSGGGAQAEAGNTTEDGKYDLVFWVYSDAVLNDQGKLFNRWVEEYCEENPDVN